MRGIPSCRPQQKCIRKKKIYNKKGGTRGSGTVAEPFRPMASKLFNKKFAQSDSDYGLSRHLQRARSAKFPAQTAGLLPEVQPIFMIHAAF